MDVTIMLKMLNALGVRGRCQPIKIYRYGINVKFDTLHPMNWSLRCERHFLLQDRFWREQDLQSTIAEVAVPFGTRPLDIHLKGFRAMGVDVTIEHGFVQMMTQSLKGNRIYLDFPSVGATENIMMAATLADGTTIIENAAQEPEITDLAQFLNAAGAQISGAGSSTITIHGVQSLKGKIMQLFRIVSRLEHS